MGQHRETPPDRLRKNPCNARRGPPPSDRPSRVLTLDERTYAGAGVSLAVADAVVERLRAAVESTGARGFGAFAGVHPLDERRLLAASTDGVGTKLMLARDRGALRA